MQVTEHMKRQYLIIKETQNQNHYRVTRCQSGHHQKEQQEQKWLQDVGENGFLSFTIEVKCKLTTNHFNEQTVEETFSKN